MTANSKKKKYRPVEPVNKNLFLSLGLSIDPKDIPNVKQEKSIIRKKFEEHGKAREAAVKAAEQAFDNANKK